jgi:hypothetical protein
MVLPAKIPAATLQELRDNLATIGVAADFLPGHRITLAAEFKGNTWTLAYIGHGKVWKVQGPGYGWGPAVFTEELADFLTTATEPPGNGDPCMPHQRYHCGHCPHQDCQDCEHCPCSCNCAAVRAVKPGTTAPKTYAGVPVPVLVRQQWDQRTGHFWRLGVRSTLAVA